MIPRPRPASGNRLMVEADEALRSAVERLLKLQDPAGYWWGELESNCSMEAEYLLMARFLGVLTPHRRDKIVQHLLSKQLPDGGWPVWHGGHGNLNITVEAYLALRVAGVPHHDPAMERARRIVLAQGGLQRTRTFTKIWLALFGQWDWDRTPTLPPELVLLPSWSPLNIYEFASWARATIVPCTILLTLRPVCRLPEDPGLESLLSAERGAGDASLARVRRSGAWPAFFRAADSLARSLERSPVKPLRRRAIAEAVRWILDHQEEDGTWGGIQPPWVYSLMALRTLGYSLDHPVIQRGLRGFDTFGREDPTTWRMDPCISPVWDTGLALLALTDAGLPPSHPEVTRAVDWLMAKQILDKGGDWRVKNPRAQPGGWPFEFHNDRYPDIDDTAMVLIALRNTGLASPEVASAFDRGLAWTISMQSRNGGWASFDKDNTRRMVGAIPFCDFGEVLDPPTEDVTAHVVELLGRAGFPRDCRPLQKGLAFLRASQLADGSWFGRWGVNYIYGLGAVLPALRHAGEDMAQPYVQRAVRWLMEHQQPDGGWGEGCESYTDPSLAGMGPSTASQTAWALLALLAADGTDGEAMEGGVQYLLEHQDPSGSWDEPHFTGTGFPGVFMLNYHLYRLYWPVMALGRYLKQHTAGHA